MSNPTIDEIKAMEKATELTVNWSEEGGAVIRTVRGGWALYEVPQYGGKPHFHGVYKEDKLQEMLDLATSWI